MKWFCRFESRQESVAGSRDVFVFFKTVSQPQRQFRGNHRARIRRANLQLATQMPDAFRHPAKAKAVPTLQSQICPKG